VKNRVLPFLVKLMAIYRIKSKLFTRAERKMIKQIWRKTKGLTELPKGITNLEDARALKKLSGQLISEESVKITPEIRKALDNLGFTKATEDTINKMRSKYRNAEAKSRLSRLRDIRSEKMSRSEGKKRYLRHEKKTENLEKQMIQASENFRSAEHNNSNIDPSLVRFYRKKLGGSVLRLRPGSNRCGDFALTGMRRNTASPIGIKGQFPEVSQVTKKDLKNYNKNGHAIGVSDKSSRGVVLHEIGHIKSAKEFEETFPVGKIEKGIDKITEENMASSNALHVLRNQKGVEKDKETLDKAISTYMHGLKYNIRQ
jgi:hypothetical protein